MIFLWILKLIMHDLLLSFFLIIDLERHESQFALELFYSFYFFLDFFHLAFVLLIDFKLILATSAVVRFKNFMRFHIKSFFDSIDIGFLMLLYFLYVHL